MRMMPPAPNALHCVACPPALSFARSHESATLRPARLSGTPGASPLAGVIIRQRQSSVTTETQ